MSSGTSVLAESKSKEPTVLAEEEPNVLEEGGSVLLVRFEVNRRDAGSKGRGMIRLGVGFFGAGPLYSRIRGGERNTVGFGGPRISSC